jgi:hypothetical protein
MSVPASATAASATPAPVAASPHWNAVAAVTTAATAGADDGVETAARRTCARVRPAIASAQPEPGLTATSVDCPETEITPSLIVTG